MMQKKIVRKTAHLLSRNILSTAAVLSLMGVAAFAAAPTGGYLPGATLDPDCTPGDTDCIVQGGDMTPDSWTMSGTNVVVENVNVGIGTVSPLITATGGTLAKLTVSGGDAHINGVTFGKGNGTSTSNIVAGYQSGYNNTGVGVSAVGYKSAENNIGNHVTANGYNSAQNNTASNVTTRGYESAQNNTGTNVTANGFQSAQDNTGSNVTANGIYSAKNNTVANISVNGYASGENNSGTSITANGMYSAQNNTGNSIAVNGYGSGQNNSGVNVVANGFFSAQNNIGNYITANGYTSAQNNTAYSLTANGYASGQNNSGANVTVNGMYSGQNNTGANVAVNGYATGQYNIGNYLTAQGAYASMHNTGNYVTVNGYYGARHNTGHNLTANGYHAAYFNTKNNNTVMGYGAYDMWVDAGSFTITGADSIEETVTIVGHTIAIGNSLALKVNGTGVGGLVNNTVYTFTAIDANTLKPLGTNITGFTSNITVIANSHDYTNITALGYNSEPSADNQITLGNASVNRLRVGSTELGMVGGNVGIGTLNPSSSLHVLSDAETVHDFNFNINVEDSRAMDTGVGAGILLGGPYTSGGAQTTFGGIWTEKDDNVSGNYGASLNFGSRKHANGLWTDMTIASSGNVGIGTTNARTKFSVVGLPSGTSKPTISGDSSATVGQVCITASGSMWIDTDGGCND